MDPRAAAALEESAEDLYENAPCGYLSALPDGTIVKVNQTLLTWIGYSRDEIVGERFQNLLTAGGRIFHETHYAPLLRMQGAVREIAVDIVCADGRQLPALINSVVRFDVAGEPVVTRTTVFNATDRKQYEVELVRARERERVARERTEKLQRLTAALAGAGDEEQVIAAVVAELGAVDGVVSVSVRLMDNDEDAPPTCAPAFEGPKALLPLLVDARMAGTVRIDFAADRDFQSDEQAFLVACATQASVGLERARLHAQTVDAGHRSAFLAEAIHALNVVTSVAERAERLAHLLVPAVVDAARLEVLPAVDDEPRLVVLVGDRALLDAGEAAHHLALPLDAGGRLLGTLTIARTGMVPPDRGLLEQLAERTAVALENARLYEQERSVAHALQQSLLAGQPPSDPRFAVGASYSPGVEALEVGGDWYDTFAVGDDKVAAVVGDVVGRGIDAATAMGQLRSAVRALALVIDGPARLIEQLDAFVDQVEAARMATVAYIELDLDSGRMRYACAGHPPPVVLQPGADPEYLWDGRSMPLGVDLSGRPRPEEEVVLRPGSRLLLYSDGLVERRDEPLNDGLARLAEAFASRRDEPLPVLASHLATAMISTDATRDDVCVLCCSFS